jgi:CRP-like cAMP-binding protein
VNLPDGRRQILDFYIPGELAGYSSRPTASVKAAYVCLTNVIAVGAADLVARTQRRPARYPGLAAAWHAIEDEYESRLVDQIVRLGSMPAQERMLHLIGNLQLRHQRAGIGAAGGFIMPLTQETIGDAIGLSTIHVNRVLQQLRREQIIKTSMGRIEVLGREPIKW